MLPRVIPEPASHEETLFHAARQLADPAARTAFLEAACRGQSALRERLENLLSAGQEAEAIFDTPVAPPSPLSPFTPGSRFGDYELLAELGRGGMGTVYRARQVSTEREVALKILRAGAAAAPEQIQRFQVEAQAAAQLDHPNIVRIHEVGCCDGAHFFSMELVEGRQKEECRMQKQKAASTASDPFLHSSFSLLHFLQIARAVQYAHERGVLHRDLKPANVIVDQAGVPHLIDFGLAKLLEQDSALTRTADVMGTPSYMAPEQARGRGASVATDVYGLGTILYESLTGRPPFRANSPVETLRQVIEQNPIHPTTLNPAVDSTLALICLRCLEKDPQHRYASVAALIEDLERWQRRDPILARPVSLLARSGRWARRNPLAASFIATLCLSLIASLALLRQVSQERNKQAALAEELRTANQESTRLLARAVGMVRENLETLWASEERRSMLVGSDEIAALANRPIVPLPSRATVARYTLGVMAEALPTSRAQQHAELLGYLEEQLTQATGQPVRIDVRFYKFVTDCREDLCAGKVDFARLGALPYLRSRQQVSGLQPLAVPVTDPKIAVFFTRAGSEIRSLADLHEHRIAFGDTNSTVSFRSQMELAQRGLSGTNLSAYEFLDASLEFAEEVRELGIDEALKRIGYLHSHAQVIEGVLSGRYDAGVAAFRAFQINLSRGLTAIPDSEFVVSRKVWVARAGLDPRFVQSLRRAMTALRGQPWLPILPDRPTGYEEVTEATFATEQAWLDRVATLFPIKPSPDSALLTGRRAR